jgi:hypothetical protein
MKIVVSSLLLLLLVTACQSTPPQKFAKRGVSFTCPESWKITEQEAQSDGGYYLAMEKDGIDASGLVAITWVTDSMDLDLWLEGYVSGLANNAIYKNANLVLEDPVETTYNGIYAKAQSFTCSILTVGHRATIYSLHGKNKTICIMKQEATEDISENAEGFEAIEKSFKADN